MIGLINSSVKMVFLQIWLFMAGFWISFGGFRIMFEMCFNNESSQKESIWTGLILIVSGMLILSAFFYIWQRLGDAVLSESKIVFATSKKEMSAEWTQVEYIRMIKILPKHTYMVKFYFENRAFLFLNPRTNFGLIPFQGDNSKIGRLISKIKEELKI